MGVNSKIRRYGMYGTAVVVKVSDTAKMMLSSNQGVVTLW